MSRNDDIILADIVSISAERSPAARWRTATINGSMFPQPQPSRNRNDNRRAAPATGVHA
jgi:hypothetical protein